MTVDRRFALLRHSDHPNGLFAGPNDELQLSSDGTDSTITYTGTLLFKSGATERARLTAGGSFQIGSSSGTNYAFFGYRNSGSDITGHVRQDGGADILQISDGGALTWAFKDGGVFRGLDNVKATYGNSDDLQVFHDGTDSRISNATGKLRLYNSDYGFTIQPANTLQNAHAHGVSLTTINQSAAGRLVTNTAGVNHAMHGFSDIEGLEISAGSTAGFIAGIALNPGGATTPSVRIFSPAGEAGRFDSSATATHTRFMVYDVDNGALERVTVGAADSGGAGFKVLRIPN